MADGQLDVAVMQTFVRMDDAGRVFDADRRKVATRLVGDDANPSQKSYLLELVDNPAGVPSSRHDMEKGFVALLFIVRGIGLSLLLVFQYQFDSRRGRLL